MMSLLLMPRAAESVLTVIGSSISIGSPLLHAGLGDARACRGAAVFFEVAVERRRGGWRRR